MHRIRHNQIQVFRHYNLYFLYHQDQQAGQWSPLHIYSGPSLIQTERIRETAGYVKPKYITCILMQNLIHVRILSA